MLNNEDFPEVVSMGYFEEIISMEYRTGQNQRTYLAEWKRFRQWKLKDSAKKIVNDFIVNSAFASGSSTDSNQRSHPLFFCCLRQEFILQWDWAVQEFKVLGDGDYSDVLFVNERAYEEEFFRKWYRHQQDVGNRNTDPFREPVHFVFTRSEMEVAVKAEVECVAKAISISIGNVLYWLKQAGVIEQIDPRVTTPVNNRLTIIDGSHEIRSRRRLMPLTNTAHNSELSLVVILSSITIADFLQQKQEQGQTSSFNALTEAAPSLTQVGYFSSSNSPHQNSQGMSTALQDLPEVFRLIGCNVK